MNSSGIDTDSTRHATEADALVQQIVGPVADAEGVAPTDLPPLYDAIDPGALSSSLSPGADATIEFTYCGHQVVVRGDGEIEVEIE